MKRVLQRCQVAVELSGLSGLLARCFEYELQAELERRQVTCQLHLCFSLLKKLWKHHVQLAHNDETQTKQLAGLGAEPVLVAASLAEMRPLAEPAVP